MKKPIIVLAAAAFFLFITVIVILADQGRLPGIITALYNFPNGDKVGHFLLMGGLSLLVNLAIAPRPIRRHVLATLIVAALVALEEASQAWFGTRHADIADLAVSLAGIVCLGGWLRGNI
jgi:hypothetical protein